MFEPGICKRRLFFLACFFSLLLASAIKFAIAGFLGETERMTWLHNSILNYLTLILKENKPSHLEIFADLEGHNVNGGTIPQHIMVTSSRPDLVMIQFYHTSDSLPV